MPGIDENIDFILEIDRMKNISRKTRNVSNDRFENDAEHSWHACVMAMMFKGLSNKPVDLSRVIQMLLVHDLGEIYGGDVIVYAKNSEQVTREREAIRKLISRLDSDQQDEIVELTEEFEARVTDDAKFANAIDRTAPILQNIMRNGETWKRNGIRYERVIEVNQLRISEGSRALWAYIKYRLDEMRDKGLLKDR